MGKNVARLAVMFGLGFLVGVAIDAAKNQDECHECLLVEDERKRQKPAEQECQPEVSTNPAPKPKRYNNAVPQASTSETAQKMKSWGFDKDLLKKMFPSIQKSPAAEQAFLDCLHEICKQKEEGNRPSLDPRTSILQ